MRTLLVLLVFGIWVAGCATSTVETRKKERSAAFDALAPDQQALVSQGQIQIGMPPDAVYLAWGAPEDVIESETPQGHITRWLYQGQFVQEYRYWTRHHPESDYYPRYYVRAEVVFQNGRVLSWRTFPKPVGWRRPVRPVAETNLVSNS